MRRYVYSDESLSSVVGLIRAEYRDHGYVQVDIRADKHRSLSQNALIHAAFNQAALQLGESALSVKCEAKLRHGVPILRAEEDEFREWYDELVKGRYSYEEKLRLMEHLPVTSLMTTDQLSQFAESFRDEMLERGVYLEFPE